ncbi:MAG TPA: chemotaxis protein CheA [Rhodocyclaceae bacterium]|nr:chemotaxis protein CheA [Rhodocyclaceae bacterium]
MEEIYAVFAQEAREQLAELEAGLLRMEQGDTDSETINGIFRAAHTIKGGAGVVELSLLESFTHGVENALDKLRNGEIAISGALITVLLRCCDHLGQLLDRVDAGEFGDDDGARARGDALGGELRAFLGAGPAPESHPAPQEPAPVQLEGGSEILSDCWHISIRFGRDVLRQGMEPSSFLKYLLNLGEIVHVTTLWDNLPPAEEMDPESCYLGFEVNFRSKAEKAAIERVFDFVRDDCELHILPPHSKIGDYMELIKKLPEEPMRLGEILVKSGALTEEELEIGLRQQKATVAQLNEGSLAPPLGQILVEDRAVHPEIVDAAVGKQKQVAEKKAADARLIRVQADKLDQLIDLVGEMVIAGASANLLARQSNQRNLVESTSILSRLVEQIRDAALQLRMVQIGETFNRFHRVVRDVSRDLDKDIELAISGGETELDKSVVEKIGDPLMHLVRNALDHGIEATETRLTRGKPAHGRVGLHACHDSGNIVIQVSDDGGGLNRQRILAKARERGLVQPAQELSDQEIINLIFEPGFSTAEQVSNLSGRGVGMDVVRKNIQSLRGTVDVASVEGEGSTFTIRLPLTLAIIDGFLVGVDKSAYVIPLDSVIECIELSPDPGEANYLNLRGEVLPFLRLRRLFEVEGQRPGRENVVVVQYGGRKAGIVVDRLLGEFQTVIKPLGAIFSHLRGIGGSTILGNGEVALILDVPALIDLTGSREAKALAAPVGC